MDEGNLQLAKELRKELHKCPEESGNEYRTKNMLMDFIYEHTDLKIRDKGKWFYVIYEEGASETIGFRADMDAVATPEGVVRHACGHDGHSATLVGLILEIDRKAKEHYKFGKNICFIFQHGEETGEGGQACSHAIAEAKIRKMYAYHNIPGFLKGAVLIRKGTFACTSKGIILHFSGTPTHAAYPEFGRNPATAIGIVLSEIPALTADDGYKGMALCTVVGVHVGTRAFGVAASEGEILLTVRGEYEEDMHKMQEKLQNRAKEISKTSNLSYSVKYCDEFPETVNHDKSISEVERVCKEQGMQIIELPEPFRWSEDFGYYLKKCEGAMLGIGAGVEQEQLHTAAYEFPDEIIENAVDIFLALAENGHPNLKNLRI